jgi:methylthioribose-1-phosphate isomerase
MAYARVVDRLPHPEPLSGESYSAVELAPTGDAVFMLDQRRLPAEEQYVELRSAAEVAEAIRAMVVRGAPAIGISAAYGLVLAARQPDGDARAHLDEAAERLRESRPTAVNLFWAIERMLERARTTPVSAWFEALADEARAIHREDVAACRAMGAFGAASVPDGATVLTHCNAGALATGGYGTALGVIRAAAAQGKRIKVFADETRPYLQGARLTAWELAKSGIDVTVICDSSAGYWFSRDEISLVVVGADRIAANGDFANKIGTYSVACLARVHERPFYVAAPWSTVDRACPSGGEIAIENRDAREISEFAFGSGLSGEAATGGASRVRLVPAGVAVRNPAFDVTPARYVASLFTERGVLSPVDAAGVARLEKAVAARPRGGA